MAHPGEMPATLRSSRSGSDQAEGEVDAFAAPAQPGRESVLPVLLGGRFHQQQVAIGQIEGQGRLARCQRGHAADCRRARPETKGAHHPEAEGGDRMVDGQFGFVIRMPAHSILPTAVAVQQQAVEAQAEPVGKLVAQAGQRDCPGQGGMAEAAVAVGAARIAIPAHQTGNGVQPPKHPHVRLLPGDSRAAQVLQQGLPFLVRQPAAPEQKLQARSLDPERPGGFLGR